MPFLGALSCIAQDAEIKNQVIRGTVVDRTTGQGIARDYVELLNYTSRITAISEENSSFELKNIPVGHQRIRVELEGNKRKDEGRYRSAKMEATDEMNAVSVRAFNVEDVTKCVLRQWETREQYFLYSITIY